MIIGIDASNIRSGGGVTHLTQLLRAADPHRDGFTNIYIWACSETLKKIEEREWINKISDPLLDKGLLYRLYWQKMKLSPQSRKLGCQVLFVPGGFDISGFSPLVAMSQNLLPFEDKEMKRYKIFFDRIRFLLLRLIQSLTFKKAAFVIFLTHHARDIVLGRLNNFKLKTSVIFHGIDSRFFCLPRRQRAPEDFTALEPCRILYVSQIDLYKHQWEVVKAVAYLRSLGFNVVLDLIGQSGKGLKYLQRTMAQVDPLSEFIFYKGSVAYQDLPKHYLKADLAVIASSCETFGQILTEAMACGLPVTCSKIGAFTELLGKEGLYFNPEDFKEIANACKDLINSPQLREKMAHAAFKKAQSLSWERCAQETFYVLLTAAQNRAPTMVRGEEG